MLLLRHDPVDFDPHAGCGNGIHGVPKDAIDATGPLFWLQIWPEWNPSLPRTQELKDFYGNIGYALETAGSAEETEGGDLLEEKLDSAVGDSFGSWYSDEEEIWIFRSCARKV